MTLAPAFGIVSVGMDVAELPEVIVGAWAEYGDPRRIVACEETSPGVSTNRVFRLDLSAGDKRAGSVFAKVSSYGSYIHFRQDHARIARWSELLAGTGYASFLAPVLEKDGSVFTFRDGGSWVVFYGEVPRRGLVPRVLSDTQIENLAEELARFHQTCDALRMQLDPTWKSLGSDIADLYDRLDAPGFCAERGLAPAQARYLKAQCDTFLEHAEALGYHRFHRIPVLVDWNRGNFSVQFAESGFRLFSRWDYDWFRIEPRMLDFYFLARVVRAEGDQTTFSYLPSPFFEPRFARALAAYHRVFALSEPEVLFLKEVYRFFVLNYVIRVGEHFFVPEICQRLTREVTDLYLPALEQTDFGALAAGLR